MLRTNTLLLLGILMLCGCGRPAGPQAAPESKPAADNSEEQAEPAEEDSDSLESSLRRAVSQVEQKSRQAANGVSEMVTDLYDDATAAGNKATKETVDWVTSAYETAKESGQTNTANARDWVLDDLQRGGAWEYQVLPHEGTAAEEIQTSLNELGRERWECYHVVSSADGVKLYLKRPSRSMLRSLPLRDVMRILPLLGGGGDSDPTE